MIAIKEIGIDYPRPYEAIQPAPYALRVTAPTDARDVRVSINDGYWLPLRQANGFWWLDFTPLGTGNHFAISRVVTADGSVVVSQPRLFQVAQN